MFGCAVQASSRCQKPDVLTFHVAFRLLGRCVATSICDLVRSLAALSVEVCVRPRDQRRAGIIGHVLGQADGDRARLRCCRQQRVDASEPMLCGGNVDALDSAQKLIAAVSDDQVVRTQRRLQRGSHLHQQLIAGRVAMGIVDYLQVVDVQERQNQRMTGSRDPGDLSIQFHQAGLPGVHTC